MRKTPVTPALLLLAGLLLFLSACGAGAESVAPTSEPPTAEATDEAEPAPAATDEVTTPVEEESAASETRTFTNVDGSEVELPANPQRVVTLSERDMDAALALGASVVGVVNGRGAMEPPRYLQPYLGDAISIGAFSAPSPEAILNLEPDLILIGGLFPELEAQLPAFREIAPVAITHNSTDDWVTSFMNTAEALNLRAEAEQWMAGYAARVKSVQSALGDNGGAKISIVRFNPDGPVVMAPSSFGSLITASVGLGRPEQQVDIAGSHGAHSDTISQERLDVIDGDWIFAGYLNPDGAANLDTTLEQPLIQSLGAVAQGHISIVDGAVWTSMGGPLAAMTILDDIEAALGGGESVTATSDAPDNAGDSGALPLPRTVMMSTGTR